MRRPDFIARQAAQPTGLMGGLLLRLMAHETRGLNLEVLDALAPADGDRIVEIGFGHGSTLCAIAAKAPHAALAGIDLSADAARFAARRCKIGADRIDLRAGDSAQLPWPDASFDKAYSVHTIYFWTDPQQNLSEVRRVLRPGGRLVLGLRERSPAAVASFPAPVYRFYSDDELVALLQASDFTEIEVRAARSGGGDLGVVSARKPAG
jgi:ubiquinone/menaquinone biosynthesis C-methylase UbiE